MTLEPCFVPAEPRNRRKQRVESIPANEQLVLADGSSELNAWAFDMAA